jgi:transcriptional regulator with XRE-family HTH domain
MRLEEKLRLLLARTGWSVKEQVERIGVSADTLYGARTWRQRPRNYNLKKFAEAFGVRVEYLLDDDLSRAQFLALIEKGLEPTNNGVVEERDRSHPPLSEEGFSPVVFRDILANWDWEDFEFLRRRAHDHVPVLHFTPASFCVVAEGPDLTGDEFRPGTAIHVRPETPVTNGDFVLVRSEHGPALRQYFEEGGTREIRSLHPAQKTVLFNPASPPKMFMVAGGYFSKIKSSV